LARGFRVCESGPLVRSSYRADEQAALLSKPRHWALAVDAGGSCRLSVAEV